MTTRRTTSLIATATGWNAVVATWLALRLAPHEETAHLADELVVVAALLATVALRSFSRLERDRSVIVLTLAGVLGIAIPAGALDHVEGLVHRWQCLHNPGPGACMRAADYHAGKPGWIHEEQERRFLELACHHGDEWRACAVVQSWSAETRCDAAEAACVDGDDDACAEVRATCTPDLTSRCRDGEREACYDAARALEYRDRELALTLFAEACELADDAEDLEGCFELADSGRADVRDTACRTVRDVCHFRPTRACEVYLERCELFETSPFDAR